MDFVVCLNNGSLEYHKQIIVDYIIKIPTRAHRLTGTGTVSLDLASYYTYKNNKKGLVFIDMNTKSYALISKSILDKAYLGTKAFNGVRDTLHIFDIKKLVADRVITLVPIPNKVDINKGSVLAQSIKEKFNL